MANDAFAQREQEFNKTLGGTVAGFAAAIVDADSRAKDAHVDRVAKVLDAPNVQFQSSVSLIGREERLSTTMDVPRIAVTKVNPIEIESADLAMSMSVSASQESSSDLASKTSVGGSGKIGWGPVSFGVKFNAEVSVAKSEKRSSDYRATTDAKMRMVQGTAPEGLSVIVDAISETVRTGLEINKGLMQLEAQKAAEAAGLAVEEPADAGDGGDDGN